MTMQPFELIPGERYVFMANTDEYGGNYSGIFDGADAEGRCKFRDCVKIDPEEPDVCICIEAAAIIDIEHWPTKLEFEPEWSHEFEAMQRTKEVRIAV